MLKKDEKAFEPIYNEILRDFKRDVTAIYKLSCKPPVRGAKIAGAKKTAISNLAIQALLNVANADLTITSANEILKRIINRSIRYEKLVEHFGTRGRDASKKTKVFKNLEEIEKYAWQPLFWYEAKLREKMKEIIEECKRDRANAK